MPCPSQILETAVFKSTWFSPVPFLKPSESSWDGRHPPFALGGVFSVSLAKNLELMLGEAECQVGSRPRVCFRPLAHWK